MFVLPMEKSVFCAVRTDSLNTKQATLSLQHPHAGPNTEPTWCVSDVQGSGPRLDNEMKFITHVLLFCHVFQISNALYTRINLHY